MISIYGKYSTLDGIDEPHPITRRTAPGYYWSRVMLSWRRRIVTWIPRYNFPLHNFPVHHVSINVILFSHRRSLPPRILWRHPLMLSSFSLTLVLSIIFISIILIRNSQRVLNLINYYPQFRRLFQLSRNYWRLVYFGRNWRVAMGKSWSYYHRDFARIKIIQYVDHSQY